LLAEVDDQVAQAAIAIAEVTGDLLQGAAFHEDSPEGFIASVQALVWLEKEVQTAGIVHGATSRIVTYFGFRPRPMICLKRSCKASKRRLPAAPMPFYPGKMRRSKPAGKVTSLKTACGKRGLGWKTR
jgi:hypothetical protein